MDRQTRIRHALPSDTSAAVRQRGFQPDLVWTRNFLTLHIANHGMDRRSAHPQRYLSKGLRLNASIGHPSPPVFRTTDGSKRAAGRIALQLSVDSLFRAIGQVCTSPRLS